VAELDADIKPLAYEELEKLFSQHGIEPQHLIEEIPMLECSMFGEPS
jgi:hypothetical protein